MKILSYLDVMKEKLSRQSQIKDLETDVHGHCIHVGPVSYACRGCFAGGQQGGIQIGNKCMVNCPMCYYDPLRDDTGHEQRVAQLLGDFYQLRHENAIPYAFSYQSSGETLSYIDDLEKFAVIFKEIEEEKNCEIYHHLYTNGILANKEILSRLNAMEVDEIRFHISASNFSKKVIDNMYEAAKMGFIVSVEEPAWPIHEDIIMKHLPIFEDIGVQHLNIVECQVTEHNIDNIEKTYGFDDEVGIFKDYFWHLYDNGMVYNIMEEVIAKDYSFSILDCNSGVERCRHGKMHHVFDSPNLYDDGFAEYYGFRNRLKKDNSEE